MVQILLPLPSCVTLASPGTSLSLAEGKAVNTGKSLHLLPAWMVPGGQEAAPPGSGRTT